MLAKPLRQEKTQHSRDVAEIYPPRPDGHPSQEGIFPKICEENN
jgi:hypothetical protein